jgi:hypothetical protein
MLFFMIFQFFSTSVQGSPESPSFHLKRMSKTDAILWVELNLHSEKQRPMRGIEKNKPIRLRRME